ncbi:DUF192 domain-containing protein [Marinobacter sp. CHS3-4]|uniref:DUF192 domain-containing protein n=1 Tax=Marinobacter sp. CHS3-4 TaxID=3045174 RepID=UPI0024B622B2|nr:DUF192 domain-containing protein [Marinobacter sp. CHS3-4]MDI9245417.1 DUF192 domain-containing protein [Marinobacter sp. CHS3-4]
MRLAKAALSLIAAMSFSVAAQPVPACFLSLTGDRHAVSLEIARTPAERRQGLMGRESLKTGHGMLFIYPSVNKSSRGFWMRNTLIPLDIAYLGSNKRVASIRHMEPCIAESDADCPIYSAGVPYQYAVEMNAGFFDKLNIKPGYQLLWGSEAQVCHQAEQSQ